MQQVKCSPFQKALKNNQETITYQGKIQVKFLQILKLTNQKLTIKYVIPKEWLTKETKDEIQKIKKLIKW